MGHSTNRTSAHSAEETVKDFWATRPTRPGDGRVVAGVAAGIGRRYGIDPTIVRVVLIVAAVFGGSGLLFYLLGWLFLAAEQDEVSAFEGMIGRGRSSVSSGFTVLLCLALIPASNWVWGGHLSTVLGALAVLAALFLLHRGRSGHGQIVSPGQARTGSTARFDQAATASAAEPVTERSTGEPPAWDPLGAAPFAWDLPNPNPEPTPPPPPPSRRRRSKVTPVSLAAALIAAGALVLLNPVLGGWADWTHILGVVTAILGLGLVAGAFVGGGRGMIWLVVLFGAAGVLGVTAHSFESNDTAGAVFAPKTAAAVQSQYQKSAGNLTLDLTGLPETGDTVTTRAQVTAGDITVLVPAGAKVTAHCQASAGSVHCLGESDDGLFDDLSSFQDAKGPLTINVDAIASTGEVQVISK